jgi:hypothetical protein
MVLRRWSIFLLHWFSCLSSNGQLSPRKNKFRLEIPLDMLLTLKRFQLQYCYHFRQSGPEPQLIRRFNDSSWKSLNSLTTGLLKCQPVNVQSLKWSHGYKAVGGLSRKPALVGIEGISLFSSRFGRFQIQFEAYSDEYLGNLDFLWAITLVDIWALLWCIGLHKFWSR